MHTLCRQCFQSEMDSARAAQKAAEKRNATLTVSTAPGAYVNNVMKESATVESL